MDSVKANGDQATVQLHVTGTHTKSLALLDDAAERTFFLGSLRTAITDPHSRLRVVITLRADFYDHPLHYPRFADMMESRTQVVIPFTPHELEQAITGPALRVGVHVEPGLVAAVIADVNAQPGGLPLLQYALTELFEQRDGNTLTMQTYRAIGGVLAAESLSASTMSHISMTRHTALGLLLQVDKPCTMVSVI